MPHSTVQPPALWRVADLALYLGRSPRWIWTALRRPETEPGSLPCRRLPGGTPRFDPREVEAWVQAGCPPAATFRGWLKRAS